MEKILRQDGSVVNIVTRGGQAALHLAMQWPGVVASIIRCGSQYMLLIRYTCLTLSHLCQVSAV